MYTLWTECYIVETILTIKFNIQLNVGPFPPDDKTSSGSQLDSNLLVTTNVFIVEYWILLIIIISKYDQKEFLFSINSLF